MAIHSFVCGVCKIIVEDINTKIVHVCPRCGKDMRWDVRITSIKGDYSLVSSSLAVNPSQIKEHRELFPDVNVLPDGRLHFTSFKSHDNYLKKTGFEKRPQKIKTKGIRIA